MTPASMLARKRALLQLAGGAMPDTPEVDVSEVPVALPEEAPEQPEALDAPSPELVTGQPQDGSVRDMYGEALDRQSRLQLLAGLSRAGGTAIQAISGVAPDAGAASALEEQAKSPVVEYLQRMKLADASRKAALGEAALRAKAEASDPKSAATIAARRNLKVNFPSLTDADLEGVTAANAHDFGVIRGQSMQQMQHAGDKIADIEQKGKDRALREKELALKGVALKQAREQFAQTLGLRYDEMDAENQRAVDRLLETKAGREQQGEFHTEDQTKSFGEKYEASGLPEFEASYKAAQEVIARHPTSLPGTGPVQGRMAGLLVGQDGKQLRSAMGKMKAAYQKSVTGTGAGEKEQEEIARASMLMDTGDDESIKLGLTLMKRVMDAKADALKAGYTPGAVDAYVGRLENKTTVMSPPVKKPVKVPTTQTFTPTEPPPAGGEKMRVILNGEPKTVPKANLDRLRRYAKDKNYTLEIPNG